MNYINLFQTSSFFGLPNSYRIVYKNSSGLTKMALLLDLVLPTPALVLALLAVLVHALPPPFPHLHVQFAKYKAP